MYTSPDFTRRGIGRMVLSLCEDAARREGFTSVELGATMGGKPLYEACGYQPIELMMVPTPGGVAVPILRMGKSI
jgi:GNAT superfamily N-acetyltransferase